MSDVQEIVDQLVDSASGADQGGENPAAGDSQKEEIIVSIGDEVAGENEEEAKAPAWVKQVRKRNRELEKELRETRRKLQEQALPDKVEVGSKPTLDGNDYDTEKYEKALTEWYEKKRRADEEEAKIREETEKANREWQDRLAAYQSAKASFKAEDYEDVESVVLDVLSQTQQGIIVHGAKDPALLIYALGKNEEKAKELAAIKDPVKFAFAVAGLEGQLKVSTRKPSTQPESVVTGNAGISGAIDKTLERLREEAYKTGDYTKLNQYRRSKRS